MSRQFILPDLGEGVKEGRVLRLLVAEGAPGRGRPAAARGRDRQGGGRDPVAIRGHRRSVARGRAGGRERRRRGGDLRRRRGERRRGAVARRGGRGHGDGRSRGRHHPPPAPGATPPRRKPASPAVRKLARTLGVDLVAVHGSGPGGRILRADVEAASGGGATAAPAPPPAPVRAASVRAAPGPKPLPTERVEPPGRDDADAHGPVRREPISQTRSAIASIMTRAAATIPHVTDTDDADVTDLDRMRRGYNDGVADESRLGMLAFVVRAVVRGLERHPIFNASYDEATGEIVYKRYFRIAVGVQTDRGLVAPVLADADRLSVPEINAALAALVERARQGTLSLDETRGATYTISNAGAMGGSRYSTPIITPPQVAVLAIGRSRRLPWVVDGTVVPRLIMPLSHSMDHRLIDGALEIAFLRQVIGDLEHPARLML